MPTVWSPCSERPVEPQGQHPAVAVVVRADHFQPLPSLVDRKAMRLEERRIAVAQEQFLDVQRQVIGAETMDLQFHVAPIGTAIGRWVEQSGVPARPANSFSAATLRRVSRRLGEPGREPAISGICIFRQAAGVEQFGEPQLGVGCGFVVGRADLAEQQTLGVEQVMFRGVLLPDQGIVITGWRRPDGRRTTRQNGLAARARPAAASAPPRPRAPRRPGSPLGDRQFLPSLEQTARNPSVEVDRDVRIVGSGGSSSPRRSVIASL